MNSRLIRTVAELRTGDHLCCLYETEEERLAAVIPFLRQGLEQGDRVICLTDAPEFETILGPMREAGVDVDSCLASGQLLMFTSEEAYMTVGRFDPDAMIAFLREAEEAALAEGYPALRVTGEMSWVQRGPAYCEPLIEYEARVNDFFSGSQCIGMCQYDRRRFEAAVLLDVVRTHPIAAVGLALYDNFYYIPPAKLLSDARPEAELRRWLKNLADRRQAEKALRQYAERLTVLHEMDRAILSAESPEAIAQVALQRMRELMPCPRATIVVFDFEAGELLGLASCVDGETRLGMGQRHPLHTFGDIEVLQQGRVHVVEDVLDLSQPPPSVQGLKEEGLRCYIKVPLMVQGELIGSLNLGANVPRAFTQEQIDIACEIAGPLAIAIHQARLREQIRRHARELEEVVARRTAELAESEARYRQLVESPVVGIWQADVTGRFVFVNRRLLEMSGYSQEEALKMTMLDPIAPELRPWLVDRMQKRRAGQLPPDTVEVEMVRRDGSRFTALATPAPLYDSQGNFAGYIGAMIDITERKRLQDEVERQLEEQRRLVQLMAGREVRMAELKDIIRQLRAQLLEAGLTPIADDPLANFDMPEDS
ncbi:MAG: PAS domain S-box protein [Chloroflexi bacterium]|nr:MAG: PAS domain S-box protein [Chloroflexota bacterium]